MKPFLFNAVTSDMKKVLVVYARAFNDFCIRLCCYNIACIILKKMYLIGAFWAMVCYIKFDSGKIHASTIHVLQGEIKQYFCLVCIQTCIKTVFSYLY